MHYTIPHYYREFSCVADKCQDTCCAGWEIMIDPSSLKKYGNVKGPMGNRLHNSIKWREGAFKRYGQRCAFLDEGGLCDLYSECGPDMLCRTCRTYPRHVEEFEGIREVSLCLSCIEAARIVLSQREPVRFLEFEREGREEDYGDFDFLLHTKLTDARALLFRILQNRCRPFEERMAMALALAHDLQRRIDGGRLFMADSLFSRYGAEGAALRFAGLLARRRQASGAASACNKRHCQQDQSAGPRYFTMKALTGELGRLEALKEDWPGRLGQLREALYGGGPLAYESSRRAFLDYCRENLDGGWQLWGEQLTVYFVFTYFCGAVYDGRAFGRMKFAAAGTLIIQELAFGIWRLQGGKFSFEDLVDIAHRYSREVEHSDENRERLIDYLEKDSRYNLESLISLSV